MHRATFDVGQASAAVKAGGVMSAILRVDHGTFYVELETREGLAELVTSNGRERRTFRDPGQALKVVRELGVASGRFALEEWDPHAPKAPAWKRPDRAVQMRERHRRAQHDAEFEADVLQALAEADDPTVPKIPHAEVMAELDTLVAEIQRTPNRPTRTCPACTAARLKR